MTVGLYINAPTAIMLSDCLALPTKGGEQLYSPSNIESYDGVNGELAKLVSKFIQVDESTLIAFAGRYDHISEFVTKFPDHWKARDHKLRPMQFLHQLDYELRSVRPGWNCSVLGASVVSNTDEERVRVNNYASLSNNWRFDTSHFGHCYAIGSGSNELRQFVENADKNIDAFAARDARFLFKMLGALNGNALFVQQNAIEKQTWGGLLQAQLYHVKERKWLRTPSWFHICVFFEGKGLRFQGLLKKAVLHTSKLGDDNTSGIITAVTTEDRQPDVIIWPVYSPFEIQEKIDLLSYSDVFRTPNQVTITEYIDIDGIWTVNHSTYHYEQVKGITFETDGATFGWNIEAEELGEWLRQKLLNDLSVAVLLK